MSYFLNGLASKKFLILPRISKKMFPSNKINSLIFHFNIQLSDFNRYSMSVNVWEHIFSVPKNADLNFFVAV